MKKTVKVILTFLFVISSFFAVLGLFVNYHDDKLVFVVLAFTAFFIHLLAWFAPKVFFNLCWKITNIMPDSFDYDTNYNKLEIVDIGLLITSVVLLGISFLF